MVLGETFIIWRQGSASEFYLYGWQLVLFWAGLGLLGGHLISERVMTHFNSPLLIEGFEELPSRPEYLFIAQHLLNAMNYRYVQLDKLQGGYESSGVFVVRGHNRMGQKFCDRVIKLGDFSDISAEQERYRQYVHGFLPHNSGRMVKSYAFSSKEDGHTMGGVLYDFARLDKDSDVRNLQALYFSREISSKELAHLLHESFALLIENWYGEGRGERVNQYRDYPRLLKKLNDITLAVQQLTHPTATNQVRHQPTIHVRGIALRNPVHFVDSTFQKRKESSNEREFAHRSIIHGDLHSRNILIEGAQERKLIWFIDFSNTQEGPTLWDFCSLEADIKFCLLMKDKLASEWDKQTWGAILEAEEQFSPWVNATASFVPSEQELAFLESYPEVLKAWRCVAVIREIARQFIFKESPPWSIYSLPLLHATLPIVYYQQCSTPQKEYALISSGWLCDSL